MASDPLRTLSRSLLRLSEQAQQVAPQDLLHQAMQTLQGLVPLIPPGRARSRRATCRWRPATGCMAAWA